MQSNHHTKKAVPGRERLFMYKLRFFLERFLLVIDKIVLDNHIAYHFDRFVKVYITAQILDPLFETL